MTRIHVGVSIAAIAVSLAQGALVHAQQSPLPHEGMGLKYSGTKQWIVYLNNTNLDFRRQPVADFASQDEAGKTRDRLNKALPLSSSYFYLVEERSEGFDPPPPAEPASPPPAKPAGPSQPPPMRDLVGSTWIGSETASDTTSLRFVFKTNGDVLAYDDTQHVWKGKWRKTSDRTVIINLTFPHAVNYYGTIEGNRITGSAKRPGANGGWRWDVKRR